MLINKKKDTTPYDMSQKPCRQNALLMPLVWGASFLATRAGKLKIKKIGMEGLKPPYIVLSEHQGFTDYYIAPLALFPHRANYISDVEGFAAFGKLLYRQVGCVPTRRFVTDISLIKNIDHVVRKNKDIIVIFPEARHSNVGTNSKLPQAVGKLIKRMQLPVVILKTHGSYLTSPIWDEAHTRKVPLSASLTKVLSPRESSGMTTTQITELMNKHFQYDEYRWQLEHKISIPYKNRAEGLHKALYACPSCKAKYSISSRKASLTCTQCQKSWQMDEYGQLQANEGVTEFAHIPDWYEWQRSMVEDEIIRKEYSLDIAVNIEILPNEKGFIPLGTGRVTHLEKGFSLTIDESTEVFLFSSKAMSSVHTEYNYREKGDCIVLSTKDCCYYLYFADSNANVTEIQFATEYFYELAHRSIEER